MRPWVCRSCGSSLQESRSPRGDGSGDTPQGHATCATSFSSHWQEHSAWEWSQLPLQQAPVPKLGSPGVVVLWEQEGGCALLLQGQNVSATSPGSEGLAAFSAGLCWKPSVPQGHPKRGQGLSATSPRGAEVSHPGIPVPHQPPKTPARA